jgi:1,4-dihydroxy-2-naphthoate octaprenyltransferase
MIKQDGILLFFSLQLFISQKAESCMVPEIMAKKEKCLILLFCLFGISGVGYGIVRDNDFIFILGLLFVIAVYLHIRRKLKKTVRREG